MDLAAASRADRHRRTGTAPGPGTRAGAWGAGYPALPVCGCGASGVVALARVAVFAVVVVWVVRSVWFRRGRTRADSGVFDQRRSLSGVHGRFRGTEDVVGPARTSSALSAGQGRPRRRRLTHVLEQPPPGHPGWLLVLVGVVVAGVLRGEGRDEPGVVSCAGPPRQNARPGCTWLPTAPAPGSGTVCCATPGLLRRFAICNATSGLTTPVNRLLKAPGVYSRALSSVVNARPAHQTPHPTPCHAMSQDIGSTPAAARDTTPPNRKSRLSVGGSTAERCG